jgi:hypothetical protein
MTTTSKLRTCTLAATLALTALGGVGCNDAVAMGRAAPAAPVDEPIADRLDPGPAAGTFEQGYELGRRNGQIISQRLRERTVETEGCRAIPRLQEALLKVTRTVRPPAHSQDALVRGFFRGYLDSVRKAIRDARNGCGVRQHTDGIFAGSLYGALLCQVSTISLEAVTTLEVESLYAGWAGSSDEIISECRTAATVTLKECDDRLPELLSASVETSCLDTRE